MSKSEKIYKQLSEHYTDEEIVEGFVFNDDSLSDDEEREAMTEFKALRLARLKNMSKEEILLARLIKLKLRKLRRSRIKFN